MKKVVCLFLACTLLFVLCACGKETTNNSNHSNNNSPEVSTTAPYQSFDFSSVGETAATAFEYTVNYADKILIKKYNGTEPVVKIPQTIDGYEVGEIANDAFKGTNVTYVYIPDTVTRIYKECFKECMQLVEVRLSKNIKEIPEQMCYGCKNLIKVEVFEGLERIDRSAFFECTSLKEINIPEGVEVIGDGAFYYCRGITEFVAPSTLTHIGEAAFSTCSLKAVDLSKADSIRLIAQRAFEENTGLEKIKFSGEMQINFDDFHNICPDCPSISTIEVEPNENGYFVENNILYYNDLLVLAARNNSVTDITVKDGTTKIQKFAFDESNIQKVTIPASCTVLGKFAFCDCLRLTDVLMSDNISRMGQDVFSRGNENIKISFKGKTYTRDMLDALEQAVEANETK